MVEQVTAWRDGEGNLWPDKIMAAEADARAKLGKISDFNEGMVNSLLANAELVVEALNPYVREID